MSNIVKLYKNLPREAIVCRMFSKVSKADAPSLVTLSNPARLFLCEAAQICHKLQLQIYTQIEEVRLPGLHFLSQGLQ